MPVEIDGIASGATTVGHRFHHPGPITIGGAADYAEKLRACHVIVDQEERERLIREGAEAAAAEAGLTLLADEGLVVENAGLTEWPVPLLGRFDADFLDVPREVIVLTMRTNQKYFACTQRRGAARAGVRLRRQHRRERRRRGDRRGQRAGCSPRASPMRASSGSRTSRSRSRSRRRSSTASSSTRSSAPSPTRSSASPSWRAGWSKSGVVKARRRPGRARRAAGQGRPRHRHGRRVPRAPGRDRRLSRRGAGRAEAPSPTRSATITSRWGRATRCRPRRSPSRSRWPTSWIRSAAFFGSRPEADRIEGPVRAAARRDRVDRDHRPERPAAVTYEGASRRTRKPCRPGERQHGCASARPRRR